jgi:hypothetical protein
VLCVNFVVLQKITIYRLDTEKNGIWHNHCNKNASEYSGAGLRTSLDWPINNKCTFAGALLRAWYST